MYPIFGTCIFDHPLILLKIYFTYIINNDFIIVWHTSVLLNRYLLNVKLLNLGIHLHKVFLIDYIVENV